MRISLPAAWGLLPLKQPDALLQEEERYRYREKWRADNKQAIEAYNERVKRDGVFGDDVRGF